MKKKTARRAARRPAKRPRAGTLGPEWQAWIAQNLMLGAAEPLIVARLVKEGLSQSAAERALLRARTAPGFVPGAELGRSSRRLLMIVSLLRELRRTTGTLGSIERRPKPSASEFFSRYLATGTPVMFTDAMAGWKALGLWSPAYFGKKLGHLDVEVTTDREADPDYDMHTREHSHTVKLRDFVQRIVKARRATNDFYMVANNHAMDRDGMGVLLDDVVMDPEYFDPARTRGAISLWLGPKGTVTPLHHDTTSIVFHQVYGRKRFTLISPFETVLLKRARGVYCDFDPEHPERHPELEGVPILDVELGPGDAMFIPVGWWHKVRSLDASISISFTNLRVANNYGWYSPGAVR